MARQSKAARAIDNRIALAFKMAADRIQIPILEIPSIYATGREAIARGASDLELASAIKAHVDRVRVPTGGDSGMTIEHQTITRLADLGQISQSTEAQALAGDPRALAQVRTREHDSDMGPPGSGGIGDNDCNL